MTRDAEAALHDLDRRMAFTVRALSDGIADEVAGARTRSFAVAAVGSLALLLSLIGIWGVASQTVVQRTREIGVRMALGARAVDVVTMLVGATLVPVIAGSIVGVLVASGLARVLAWLLYGVQPIDPLAFGGAVAVLVATAAVAAAIPARRAAHVDPLTALRTD
jgi:ABC-type antimicrobial peptide transport system permease subunit